MAWRGVVQLCARRRLGSTVPATAAAAAARRLVRACLFATWLEVASVQCVRRAATAPAQVQHLCVFAFGMT